MQAHTADRFEFAPPAQPGMLRALGLAVVAHVLLVAAISLNVQWKSDAPISSVEAELWSAVPQQAAPKLETPPPEPEPEPEPMVEAKPAPTAPTPDPSIVLEQEKKRKKAEELVRQQQLQLQQQKLEADKKRQQQEKLAQEKKAAEEKRLADEKRLTELDKRKEAQKKKEDAKKLEAQRQENIRRMTGLAGGTGAPTSNGNALRSAGPSGNYAGRIQARVRPNIVFADDVAGNPTADVEVSVSPTGTILSTRLKKSSGNPAWDNAALRAVEKTEKLPLDENGRVWSPLTIGLSPKDR